MKRLLYILIFVSPVIQSVPVANIGTRSVSLGIDTFLLMLIYLAWITARPRMLGKHHPQGVSAAFGVGGMVMCLLLSFGLTLSQPRAFGQIVDSTLLLLRWSQYVPLVFMLPNIFYRPEDIKIVVNTITASAVIISIINIVEFNLFGIDYNVARGAIWVTKSIFIETAGSNYNISGGYLMVAILLNVSRFTHAYEGNRVWTIVVLGTIILGLIYNTSRSSMLGVLLGTGILLSESASRRSHKVLFMAVIGSLIAAIFLAQGDLFEGIAKIGGVFKAIPMLFGEAISPLDLPEHVSGTFFRFTMWNETFNEILKSPIWGSGLGSLRWRFAGEPLFTADNYYFEIVADSGLIGLGVFIYMLKKFYVRRLDLRALRGAPNVTINFLSSARAIFWAILLINFTGNMFSSQTIWGMFVILSCIAISVNSVLCKRNESLGTSGMLGEIRQTRSTTDTNSIKTRQFGR